MRQSVETMEEKNRSLQSEIRRAMEQQTQLRRQAIRLQKLAEQSLNGLFSNTHIVLTGSIQSLSLSFVS